MVIEGRRQFYALRAIKQGLVLAIPFLLIGSFALMFQSLPIGAYQRWLALAADGVLLEILDILYQTTLNSLALILTVTIGISYGRMAAYHQVLFYALLPLCALCAFTGYPFQTTTYIFGPEWIFTAICVTLASCVLFRYLSTFFERITRKHTVDVDYLFNLSLQALLPCFITILIFVLVGVGLETSFGDYAILNFGSYFFLRIFDRMGSSFLAALLYVFSAHLLWFFGVHGTNTLDAVSTRLFEPGIAVNGQLLAQGLAPTEIFTKTFLDVFVFIGGCGSALCFILALLLAARRYQNRRLAAISALPVLFNISEIAIFGYPIIFNPMMLVPFVLTPLVLLMISTLAMRLELVPLAVHTVRWTVPVFFSGYLATESWRGPLLQLVNLAVGVAIYAPFIRLSERRQSEALRRDIQQMENDMREGEETGRIPDFLKGTYALNQTARMLAQELVYSTEAAKANGQLTLYYQPQVNAEGEVFGAEALLRWRHPACGTIFPPLIITLAKQNGYLDALGLFIIEQVCRDIETLAQVKDKPAHIAVNISPYQLESSAFVQEVREILVRHDLGGVALVLELTERVALASTPIIEERLADLRAMGVQISMDDFGMGHSSMMYLNKSVFDEVKLDGALVRQIMQNERSQEIVATITNLAAQLHFNVVAEYVETAEQAALLDKLGCHIFQGYYYSPAIPLDAFITFLNDRH